MGPGSRALSSLWADRRPRTGTRASLQPLPPGDPMRRLTHAEFLALRRFDALDGLRALAALIVVFYHTGGAQSRFLSGWIGVHVFFVVSGFLITTLMLREY